MMLIRRRRRLRILQFALAITALNVLLTAFSWVPSGDVFSTLMPSAETLTLLSLFALGAAWARGRWRAAVSVFFILITALLILISCAEALVRFFYDRQLVVVDDVKYIPGGLYLLFGKVDRVIGLLTAATIVVMASFGFGAAWLIYHSLARPLTEFTNWLRGTSSPPLSRRIALTAFSIAILTLAAFNLSRIIATAGKNETGFDNDLTTVAVHALSPRGDSAEFREVIATKIDGEATAHATANDTSATPLPGLDGSDVHLFFVESYGQIVFTHSQLSETLVPVLEAMEASLESSGFSIASSFITSPVVGGYSWIAEAAFLAGQNIRDQGDYDVLITSDVPSMPRMFSESGYRTILSMPGTVHGDWPEARTFYRFEEIMFGPEFGYHGPAFSFVPVPDQYALAKTYQLLESGADSEGERRPAFIQYVLVSSHAPYNRIPPYIDDWSSLGDGRLYNELEVQTFDNGWMRGTQYPEGYVAGMEYVLTTVELYLTSIVADPGLVILVGDHQPPRPLRPPTATRSVPINIISRDSRLVVPFLKENFVPGLIPDPERESLEMESFFRLFARIAMTPPE